MQELGYEDINGKMYYFEVLNRATLMTGKKSKKQKTPVSEQTALLEKIKLPELKLEKEKLLPCRVFQTYRLVADVSQPGLVYGVYPELFSKTIP